MNKGLFVWWLHLAWNFKLRTKQCESFLLLWQAPALLLSTFSGKTTLTYLRSCGTYVSKPFLQRIAPESNKLQSCLALLLSTLSGEITQTSSSGNCDKKKKKIRKGSFRFTSWNLTIWPLAYANPDKVIQLSLSSPPLYSTCWNKILPTRGDVKTASARSNWPPLGMTLCSTAHSGGSPSWWPSTTTDLSMRETTNQSCSLQHDFSSDVYKNCTASQVL